MNSLLATPKVAENTVWPDDLRTAVTGFPTKPPAVPLFKALQLIAAHDAQDKARLATAERIDAYYLLIGDAPRWVISVQEGQQVHRYVIDAQQRTITEIFDK